MDALLTVTVVLTVNVTVTMILMVTAVVIVTVFVTLTGQRLSVTTMSHVTMSHETMSHVTLSHVTMSHVTLSHVTLKVGDYCVARSDEFGTFYRAEVLNVTEPEIIQLDGVLVKQAKTKTVHVLFIDFGKAPHHGLLWSPRLAAVAITCM